MAEVLDIFVLLKAKSEGLAAYRETEAGLVGIAKAGAIVGTVLALGATVAAVSAVRMAGNFQLAMTQLVTGAGESKANLDTVSAGILNMAGKVGASASDLAKGMYLIESAGYHGAAGLKVLEASSMGARVGAADMATVANAVTSALNAYHLPAASAVAITNDLVATVAAGKLHMEDLAGSLGKVLPAAAAARLSLAEVTAAIATMTSQGTSAAEASTYLRQTILQLENPTKKARDEMKYLGLSATDIATHLGTRGLTGTLTLLTDAIIKKMGPGGAELVAKLRGASASASDFQKVLSGLTPDQQTYIGALANMVGGTKSMQAALELTGSHMSVFKGNVAAINAAVKTGGTQVKGWSDLQGDMNFQIDRFKNGAGAAAIALGTQLLPTVTGWFSSLSGNLPNMTKFATTLGQDIVRALGTVGGFLQTHRGFLMAFGGAILGVILNIGRIVGAILTWRGTQLALTAILAIALGVFSTLNPLLGFIADHMNVILPLAAGIVTVWALWNIGMAISNGLMAAGAVAQFVTGLFAIVRAVGMAQVVQWAWNVAMTANPIGVIIVAIALLVAGVIWAYKNVGWFRDGVNAAWDGLKRFGSWIASVFAPQVKGLADFIAAVKAGMDAIGSFLGGGSGGGSNNPAYRVGPRGPIRAASGYHGTVYQPTLFLAGEAGKPEDVHIGPSGNGMSRNRGDGVYVTVHAVTNADPYEIGAQVGFTVRSLRRSL